MFEMNASHSGMMPVCVGVPNSPSQEPFCRVAGVLLGWGSHLLDRVRQKKDRSLNTHEGVCEELCAITSVTWFLFFFFRNKSLSKSEEYSSEEKLCSYPFKGVLNNF